MFPLLYLITLIYFAIQYKKDSRTDNALQQYNDMQQKAFEGLRQILSIQLGTVTFSHTFNLYKLYAEGQIRNIFEEPNADIQTAEAEQDSINQTLQKNRIKLPLDTRNLEKLKELVKRNNGVKKLSDVAQSDICRHIDNIVDAYTKATDYLEDIESLKNPILTINEDLGSPPDLKKLYFCLVDEGYLAPIQNATFITPKPKETGFTGGMLIVKGQNNQEDYILKLVKSGNTNIDYALSPEIEVVDWARNTVFSTTSARELDNIKEINYDHEIVSWNETEFAKIGKSEEDSLLLVGMAAAVVKVTYQGSEYFISVLRSAYGVAVLDLIEAKLRAGGADEALTNKEECLTMLRLLGKNLARWHITTERAHLDLHLNNVFVLHENGQYKFTFIDNANIEDIHQYLRKIGIDRVKALSNIFAYDRQRPVDTIAAWWTKYDPNVLGPYVQDVRDAFIDAYKTEFEAINIEYDYVTLNRSCE